MILENDKPNVIIGLDLSINSTGFAIIDAEKNINKIYEYGKINKTELAKQNNKKVKDILDIEVILYVCDKINSFKEKYNIIDISIEDVFIKFKKTAIRLAKLNGAVLITSTNILKNKDIKNKIPLNIAHGTIKKSITNYGDATKEEVSLKLKKLFQEIEELDFTIKSGSKKTDDIFDAIAAAETCKRIRHNTTDN